MSSRMAMYASASMNQYLQQAAEDDVVCAFGPDYFHGARAGACAGSLFSASLCWYTFRRLKEDQRQVDFLAGLKQGQCNSHFSSWTLLRGLHTQPMLTTGCIALAVTSAMKCTKCYLANLRCREFFMDDVQFTMLQELSETDAEAAAFLANCTHDATHCNVVPHGTFLESPEARDESPQPPATAPCRPPSASTLRDFADTHSTPRGARPLTSLHRAPTYYDGVAVAFLGSVFDCFLPLKPVQRYHHMRAGLC
ncbi:hypothetical protein LSCM1_00124 [Leishmania martiniquensis]|uniref:Uncharacterized protein n=1 Tax=Leishmania martiniquensis TaxID=1580590 RepID=A0A836GEW5_9TRYP|nr:hypothetical protein LSCM1_00124 [Leishmania martiniquensis]